jgi:hypothetical protein
VSASLVFFVDKDLENGDDLFPAFQVLCSERRGVPSFHSSQQLGF